MRNKKSELVEMDAIRNIGDLLINPYKSFIRLLGKDRLDIWQYSIYILSIVILECGRTHQGIIISVVCICIISFFTAWIYFQVIRICGGRLSYWRSFNLHVCMGTLANIGNFFELVGNRDIGAAISFAVSLYCIYLHVYGAIVMGGSLKKRTVITYIALIIFIIAIVYIGVGVLAGAFISRQGYIE